MVCGEKLESWNLEETMAKPDLQSAKESLERIYNYGGEDAPFLQQLRTDINELLRSIAHSFCLREPDQRIELPRGWELVVTSHCNIHHHGGECCT
jgi:hypothetical protein